MQNLVGVGVPDAAEEAWVGQRPLERVVFAQKTLAERVEVRIEDLEAAHVECGKRVVAADDMQRCALARSGFGERPACRWRTRKWRASCAGPLPRAPGSIQRRRPAIIRCMHHEELVFHGQDDALAHAPDGEDALADDLAERRHRGAQHEGTGEADLFEDLADDAPLEALDVDDDVRQLGHGRSLDEARNAQRGADAEEHAADATAWSRSAPAVAPVMASAAQVWSTVRARMYPLASTSPTVTGASPCWMALRSGASRKRSQMWAMPKVSAEDGRQIATVATNAPSTPDTFHPITLTMSMLGPGAACAIANACAKSASVIQCSISTTRR